MKRLLLILAVLLVAGVLVLMLGKQPEPLNPEFESAKRLQPGPHDVDYFDVSLTDTTRVSQAHGEFKGSESRLLKTRIWYPSDLLKEGRPAKAPLPLLVYSHGFMSMRTGGAYLAEHMATKGYVVAAMDYPLTNYSAPDKPFVTDVVNQPGDVSFLLDQLLSWHRESGSLFEGSIDEKRIGVFGLSLGGMTSTLAAFHPRFGDPRIDAAVSIAGPGFMFGPTFFSHRKLPYMMIASDIDALVDYKTNAVPVRDVSGALLVTIDGATHTGFADMAKMFRWMSNPDKIGCDQVKKNIDESSGDTWYHLIGTEEEGILSVDASPLCVMDPLPPAMNVIRQHWLNQLAVASFFEAQFSEDSAVQRANRVFLTETLPAEIAEIRVEVNND
ncbi:MAG: putative dienelactone hydrolase [Paracoccaceae bacterium]|jgi:predicted dienelactone hydrolase